MELEAKAHNVRFGLIGYIHYYRGFQLVLCADVWDGAGDYAVRSFEQAVAAEGAEGEFDQVFPEPPVIGRPRGSRQNPIEYWTNTRTICIPLYNCAATGTRLGEGRQRVRASGELTRRAQQIPFGPPPMKTPSTDSIL